MVPWTPTTPREIEPFRTRLTPKIFYPPKRLSHPMTDLLGWLEPLENEGYLVILCRGKNRSNYFAASMQEAQELLTRLVAQNDNDRG